LDIPQSGKAEKNPLDAVILRGGEVVRERWSASAQIVLSSSANGRPSLNSASLIVLITNLRLIAIREMGFHSSNYDLFTEMDLESISGVSLRDLLLDTLVVVNYRAQGGTAELALFGLDDTPEENRESPNPFKPSSDQPLKRFMASLEQAVRTRLKEVELEKNRERAVFDFSALRDQMANGGIVVTTVRCPSCGANIDLPSTGDTIKCGYCGSSIQAIDLLRKLKELLSI
jgi:ribosomal protein S27AE